MPTFWRIAYLVVPRASVIPAAVAVAENVRSEGGLWGGSDLALSHRVHGVSRRSLEKFDFVLGWRFRKSSVGITSEEGAQV
jgi:hypothetical protein